jgi:TolA-binding protein
MEIKLQQPVRRIKMIKNISFFLLILLCVSAFSQVTTPVVPTQGTSFYDQLQLQGTGDIRTLPKYPRVGNFTLLLGKPVSSGLVGIDIAAKGQAILVPSAGLVSAATGGIGFTVSLLAPTTADPIQRTLLDSWCSTGQGRIMVWISGQNLNLRLTDDRGGQKNGTTPINWGVGQNLNINVMWDINNISLSINNQNKISIDKPGLPSRELMAVVLGNDISYQTPVNASYTDVLLSTSRELKKPSTIDDSTIPNEELTLRMAQGYQKRVYPVLEALRKNKLPEVELGYALAYRDIGDYDRAIQMITPITNNLNHPYQTNAAFLQADMLTDKRDFPSAYELMQNLVGNPNKNISVRAQIKQASIMFTQGNSAEANKVISDIISQNPDLAAIDEAYLLIGMKKFKDKNYGQAILAFQSIGIANTPPRQNVAIGTPLQLKVADADLNSNLSNDAVKVEITTNNGDKETAILKPAFSRGVYMGTIDTALGDVKIGDGILQVLGDSKIFVTYVDRLSAGGADTPRSIAIELATDAKLNIMAQSGVDVFKEGQGYVQKNILSDNWQIIGNLPETATAFFRLPEDGTLRIKPFTFDKSFMRSIKPGQGVYVELIEPDSDISNEADTMSIDAFASSNSKVIVSLKLTETGPHTGIFGGVIKTTPKGTPVEGQLEVDINDRVNIRYKDLHPSANTKNLQLDASVDIRTALAVVTLGQEFIQKVEDIDRRVFIRAPRVPINSIVTILLDDRDRDISDVIDSEKVKVTADSGATLDITLQETGTHTGTFKGTFKISADGLAGSLKTLPGETVTVTYSDTENPTNTVKIVTGVLKALKNSDAVIKIERQVIDKPKVIPGKSLKNQPLPKPYWVPATSIVPNNFYRITVTDEDIVPTSTGELYVPATLKAENGAIVSAPLRYSIEQKTDNAYFIDEVYIRLGSADSNPKAYFSASGTIMDVKEDEGTSYAMQVVPALNTFGNNATRNGKVEISYTDLVAADGKKNVKRTLSLPLGDDAEVKIMSSKSNDIEELKPGMSFLLQIADTTGDISNKRDSIKTDISTSAGVKTQYTLTETESHSGIFQVDINSGSVKPDIEDIKSPVLVIPFGGKVTISYNNDTPIDGKPVLRFAELVTSPLSETDGRLSTKVYDDPKFEVETIVRLGESLYAVGAAELAAQAKDKNKKFTNIKLQESKRLLLQVIDRFPSSEYVIESLYLTGKILREEQKFEEASKLFAQIVKDYPDSDFVPKALYQLVLLGTDQKDIDKASESAMQLIYGYPANSQVSDAFMLIADYYYTSKQYVTAAGIYKRIIERFPENPKVDLILYRVALCYYRAGSLDSTKPNAAAYGNAIKTFLEFADKYENSELADDSLYWAANAYNKLRDTRKAYTLLTKLLIAYPTSDKKGDAQSLRDKMKEDNPNLEADLF